MFTNREGARYIRVKPAFTTHPQNKTVREGDTVTLFCNATGNPKPTISWTIDGSTVNIKFHPRVSLGPDNKQLTVRNVTRTNSNHKYRCLANNSVQTMTSDAASLNVLFVPEVRIEGAPEEVAVVGNEIQLICHYNSSPVASEVRWLKNGEVISRNDTMENNTRGNITQFNESSIQLTINPSISSDAANYTCLVTNDVDNSSDTIMIRVKPDPPHNLLISSTTSRTLTVSWSTGFNGNSEINSYKVNISQDSQTFEDVSCQESSDNNLCTVPGVVTNVTLEDLHPFTMYYLRVFAVNKIGQSESSEVVNASTGEEVPSAPPSNFTGSSKSSTSIFVQWDQVPAADQNGVILSYTVTYTALPGGSSQKKNVTAPADQTTLTGLNEYTNYRITVFASTSKGGGNQSAPIVVITDEGIPSAPPANFRGYNTSSTSIFVQWDQVPAADQNGVILNYTIKYTETDSSGSEAITDKTVVVVAPKRNVTLENLNEYRIYNITVAASTSKGKGLESEPPLRIRTEQDKPSAPPANVRAQNTNSTSIFVQWDQVPEVDQNGVILSYTVTYRALPSGSSQTKSVIAPANQTTLNGLHEYTNYSVTVFASTSKGGGNESRPIVVITAEDIPSAPPANFRGYNTSSTSIFVQWDQVPAADQNGVILNYTIKYTETDSSGSEAITDKTVVVVAPKRNVTLENLNEYRIYNITVAASTSKGKGLESEPPLRIRTEQDKPSAPPANVRAQNTNSTSIFVQWDQVPEVDQNGVILSYTVTYRALPSGSSQTKNVTAPANQITLTGLHEYTNYSVTVFASTSKGGGNESRPIVVITAEDRPNSFPANVTGRATNSTSILVSWGEVPFPDQNGVILSYTVTYRALSSNSSKTKNVTAPANQTTLNGLNEYTNYSITVFASTSKGGGIQSTAIVVITDEDKPSAPPSNVSAHSENSTSIFVSWGDVPFSEQNGVIVNYTVTYTALPSGPTRTKVVTAPANQTTLTVLDKYTNYSITVFASTSKGGGNQSKPRVVTTDEDTPDGAPDITGLTPLDSTTVKVKWIRVLENLRNGIITRYNISYKDEENEKTEYKHIPAPALEATITGLRQKTNYTFKIRAATSKGEGPLSGPWTTETKAVPRAPELLPESKGTTWAKIGFVIREKLTSGKPVTHYQVIVVQLKEGQDAGNLADPRYKKVEANYEQKKEGEPYITAEFSSKDAKENTFTIGDKKYYSRSGVTESRRKRRETVISVPVKYLNGELEDGTETAAFQRSFDAADFYEDGELYSFKTEKDPKTEEGAKNGDPTLAIVLPIVFVLIIALVVVGIFIYRRRQNLFDGDEDEGMPMNETSHGGKASSKRNRMSGIDNHSPGETIPVEEFEGHVRRLRANGDLLFSQEYSALRPTSNFTWNATLAQENRFKNRYNNVVAYDHSRVKLNPISNVPGSDYINANYLDGYARKRAYIATQGPLPETADDFWRMVWEQNSKTIVMVTNLEEKGRVKCFQYWPAEGGETHGDIQVQLTETVELSDFTIRKFCLKKSNSRAERMVSQYHYTIWPDHGVPSCPTSVLTFVRKASGSNPPDAGPMVVHCSAGVGRTGTFIVVDAMLQRIAAEKTVDVFGYVMSLRCDRNIMVQVEEQYVFIHEVLLEAIHSGYTEVRASDLRSHIKNLMQVNQNSGQSEMEEEFARLGRGVAAPPSKFQAANMPYNKTKNRYANVLAFDDSRVKLSVITGIEGSDYINASFVDGYMMRRAFIATQAPIPDTIPDFWRMIWEQESSTVVMLSKETESGKVKVHRYWPAKQPANIGNLVVEMTNEMVYDDYTMREIKLTNTKESASRVIRQYHYTGWPDVGSPDSGTGLIDLIGQVQRWQQQCGDTTVTVHCSAGVGRTGVFCALSILIERLKSEGVVDVFQTVKQLRAQRPAMVQTKEQYEFIYFALREYLDSFDAYSNFE